MQRPILLGVICAAAAAAQNAAPPAPDLAALAQTVQQRQAEWEALTKDLNARVARMLPCDARVTAAITEASRASDARLAALADYLQAASNTGFAETVAAKLLLDAEDRRAGEAGLERADATQEQTAAGMQVEALAQSARQRPALEEAKAILDQLVTLLRARAGSAEQQAARADGLVALLRNLVTALEARDSALREESSAAAVERARWGAYYTARLSRAQTECAITTGSPAPPAQPGRGKQE